MEGGGKEKRLLKALLFYDVMPQLAQNKIVITVILEEKKMYTLCSVLQPCASEPSYSHIHPQLYGSVTSCKLNGRRGKRKIFKCSKQKTFFKQIFSRKQNFMLYIYRIYHTRNNLEYKPVIQLYKLLNIMRVSYIGCLA